MGYSSRDYAFKSVLNGVGDSATRCLFVITIAVYLLQLLTVREIPLTEMKAQLPRFSADTEEYDPRDFLSETELDLRGLDFHIRRSMVEDWLALDTKKVLRGEIWRLVTCAFCHDRLSLLHIALNMFCLWRFGPDLEALYGKREFVWFYLVSAVIASAAFILIDLMLGERGSAIGASGAIMAILAVYGCHYPYRRIYVFYLFAIEMRWAIWIFAAWDLHPLLLQLSGETVADGVAHSAHLGGLAFGLLYFRNHWRITQLRFIDFVHSFVRRENRRPRDIIPFPSRRSESASSEPKAEYEGLRVFQEQPSPLDRILQKLHTEGFDALSDDEKRQLIEESERLRSRSKND